MVEGVISDASSLDLAWKMGVELSDAMQMIIPGHFLLCSHFCFVLT